MAEGVGFEPTVSLTPRSISSRVPSTGLSHPSFVAGRDALPRVRGHAEPALQAAASMKPGSTFCNLPKGLGAASRAGPFRQNQIGAVPGVTRCRAARCRPRFLTRRGGNTLGSLPPARLARSGDRAYISSVAAAFCEAHTSRRGARRTATSNVGACERA